VRSVFRLPSLAIGSRSRYGRVSLARQIAMYLAHVAFSLSLTQTGRLFGRDRTTVAHACGVVEDLRDDPAIDKALTVLATILTAPTAPSGGPSETTRNILTNEAQHHTAKK
jgi:chromosomal replication initiation ATPase DnaA